MLILSEWKRQSESGVLLYTYIYNRPLKTIDDIVKSALMTRWWYCTSYLQAYSCFSYTALRWHSKLKPAGRQLEKIWFYTPSSHSFKLAYFPLPPTRITPPISMPKVFNSSLISSSAYDPWKLWNSINKLLCHQPISQLPSTINSKSLTIMFASFYSDKFLKIHSALNSHFTKTLCHTKPKVLS